MGRGWPSAIGAQEISQRVICVAEMEIVINGYGMKLVAHSTAIVHTTRTVASTGLSQYLPWAGRRDDGYSKPLARLLHVIQCSKTTDVAVGVVVVERGWKDVCGVLVRISAVINELRTNRESHF